MDIFAALEDRVGRLVEAHKELVARAAALAEENRALKAVVGEREHLAARVAELERERSELRERLEKLLEQLASLGV